MNKAGYVAAFFLGVIAGAFGTWKYAEAKCEKNAQEEIEAVKSSYFRKRKEEEKAAKSEEQPQQVEDSETEEEKQLKKKYSDILHRNGYVNYSTAEPKEADAKKESSFYMGAYVIPPENFGELEDYEMISLIYFADGILTDENYDPIDDEEETVGVNWSEHFGEYEDDSVYLRNDERRSDYEILKDMRKLSEVRRR